MRKVTKELRKRLGITQADVARAVGVSLFTVQHWEHGLSSPNPENAEKLEKYLEEKEEEVKGRE